MRWLRCTLAAALCLLAIQTRTVAQNTALQTPTPNRLSIAADLPAEISGATTLVAQLTQARELVVSDVHDDTFVAGRRFETLRQFYRGVPVEGGSVTRQMAGAVTISIFGELLTGIDIDTAPALLPVDAARITERIARRDLIAGTQPVLLIMPSVTGRFVLAYRATTQDQMTYYVDANTGEVLRQQSERQDEVGVGTGALGDQKKMITTSAAGAYRPVDRLRPGTIATYDTRGSEAALDRILNAGATDSDFPVDADNIWTDARVVDAHVNVGYTYDYFFKRFQWSGGDGNGRALFAVVHRGLINNAFFISPPSGPERGGAVVFGDTGGGVPVTSLDVVGHELMHGVTDASLRRRTGAGLGSGLFLEAPGTTSFTFNGTVFPCDTTVLVNSITGARVPFWCNGGRFVTASNHPGALNEGFSDIFGTSAEFFFQQPGNGPLRADYVEGEDVLGFGPIRSMNAPGSIAIAADAGAVPYPDNKTRTLNFALVIISGTQTNPTVIDIAPLAFVGGTPVTLFSRGTDSAGVHWNSTVISHAFYLAIEGGRNATSGITVTGVGAQNREQIERVFFRAMTQLMPNNPSFSTAAALIRQSAIDLYGASSAVSQAVNQALIAVGL